MTLPRPTHSWILASNNFHDRPSPFDTTDNFPSDNPINRHHGHSIRPGQVVRYTLHPTRRVKELQHGRSASARIMLAPMQQHTLSPSVLHGVRDGTSECEGHHCRLSERARRSLASRGLVA